MELYNQAKLGNLFLSKPLGGLIGFIAGATIGFQRSKNHNDQEEHEECPHCHYHL